MIRRNPLSLVRVADVIVESKVDYGDVRETHEPDKLLRKHREFVIEDLRYFVRSRSYEFPHALADNRAIVGRYGRLNHRVQMRYSLVVGYGVQLEGNTSELTFEQKCLGHLDRQRVSGENDRAVSQGLQEAGERV
jgi:hypothetical protein